MMTNNEHLKNNAILMAKEHRKNCDGCHCTISLSALASLLNQAGIELTTDEAMYFL